MCEWLASDDVLPTLTHAVSSNKAESFNAKVASFADKRVFLGRRITRVCRLAASVLQHQGGSDWMQQVLVAFGAPTGGIDEQLLRAADADKEAHKKLRQSANYKRYLGQQRFQRKKLNAAWQNRTAGAAAGVYAGTGAFLGDPNFTGAQVEFVVGSGATPVSMAGIDNAEQPPLHTDEAEQDVRVYLEEEDVIDDDDGDD